MCVLCRPELGKSLNTDEAIALGAVYQGAGHTKLFRVKKFIVKEGTLFPIQVRHAFEYTVMLDGGRGGGGGGILIWVPCRPSSLCPQKTIREFKEIFKVEVGFYFLWNTCLVRSNRGLDCY